jgi:hypothetical protein
MRTGEHERSFIDKSLQQYANNCAGNVLGLMFLTLAFSFSNKLAFLGFYYRILLLQNLLLRNILISKLLMLGIILFICLEGIPYT